MSATATGGSVSVGPAASTSAPVFRPSLLRTFLRRPLGVVATLGLIGIVTTCLLAPVIQPYDPLRQDLLSVLQGPSAAHPLGTDQFGRDILSRLLSGGRISLVGVSVALIVDVVVGVPLGVLAGYVENGLGRAIQRFADLLMSIPGLIILLSVVAVFSDKVVAPMVALGMLGAASLIRIVSSVTLTTRRELFVDAAKVNGIAPGWIMARHIVPRIVVPTAVQAALFCGNALAQQNGLAFLGFSVPPPAPSWGGMIADGASVLSLSPTFILFCGLTIAVTILCLGLIGDALGDALATVSTSASGGRRPRRTKKPVLAAVSTSDAEVADEATTKPLLRVEDLDIQYRPGGAAVTVVQGVSFAVAPGETVGIVGESGCGKTTVVQALSGILPGTGSVSGGSIGFDGAELTQMSERSRAKLRGREIALVSQEPMNSLDPAFTVGSLLSEAVRRHTGARRREAAKKVIELLELVRLPDPASVARRHVYELSGGMAQRVGIALALAGNPRLLLADEPTSALDVTVQSEILDLLRSIQREREMALVIVTHDWGVVADICDRVVVMYAGQVVETAAVEDALSEPFHPYTAGLLAAMPSRGTPGERLVSIRGSVPPPELWSSACRFADRCALAAEDCRAAPIPLATVEPGRHSRCIHVDDLLQEGVAAHERQLTAS